MYKRIFFVAALGSSALLTAQEVEKDTIQLEGINVLADLPITTETISKTEIEEKNLAQDMPILLKNATSVVTTTDAGAGVGYTSMRIRGIGNNQVNVTFNGVPVNDSDSHGVFWVDFPDVSSSSQSVTIQRGVGTSSNEAQAFGASVNVETNDRKISPFAELMATYGSFNTQKYMISGGSGDFAKQKFNVDGRVSYVHSDGYLDRAESKLFSAALNARYMPNPDTEIHVMNIFGHENTYQAWNGVDQNSVDTYGRTFNSTGAIYNPDWSIKGYYDNQVDNYDQNHLHVYWTQKWNRQWSSKTTLHYTRGIGYFEEYMQDQNLANYLLKDYNQTTSDLVRRQYLDNHFFGAIFNLEADLENNLDFYMGAAANQYIGDHYGEVQDVINNEFTKTKDHYYENQSVKTEFSTFIKALKKLGSFELFGDIQLRTIKYEGDYHNNGKNNLGEDFTPFDKHYTFINPKVGFNYNVNAGKIYATYGLTHREPTRSDILSSQNDIKEETLHDFELGYKTAGFMNLGINLFYMYYLDQLVLTGEIDDVGAFLRDNIGESYRTGIEIDASKRILNNKLNLFGNLTLSKNKNKDYIITTTDDIENLGNTDIAYSPEFISSFGLDVFAIKGLKLNLTNKYVSKQYVVNTESKNHELSDYFISDFLARYKFNFSKTNKAEISLLVNNIFDRKYANNGYDYEGTLYYYPQAGINFLAGFKITY